jgi:hypothetical protein
VSDLLFHKDAHRPSVPYALCHRANKSIGNFRIHIVRGRIQSEPMGQQRPNLDQNYFCPSRLLRIRPAGVIDLADQISGALFSSMSDF